MDIQNEIKSPIIYDGSTRVFALKLLESDRQFGLGPAFREYYANYFTGEDGVLNVGSAVVRTTPEVMAVLKAILSVGCCRLSGRATACRAVFLRICSAGTYINKDVLLSTFVDMSENPFEVILQDVIQGVLDGE